MFIRNSIAKIRLFAAAGLCILFCNCSEEKLDTTLAVNPDAAGLSGHIHMTSTQDYTSENHIIMLQDDEPESIFLDPAQRSFDPRRPVQVSVTENRELQLRAYSPRRIRDLKVWASVEGYPDEFLLAQFDIVPPFLEFRTPVPFVSADKEYTTAAGKTILILKNPHLGSEDLALRIECEDPYYKKFAAIKTTWSISFSNFEYPNHPYWLAMNPAHCREAVAMSLNMAYLFSTQEYQDSLRVNDHRFVDNALNTLSAETLLSQSLTRPSFAWGTLHVQGGLGGGGTLGLQDVCFLGDYAEYKSDNMALFHEFGQGMGYAHGNNTVISESGGKYSWRQMCQSIYLRLSLTKELPVYSRRFMHSRRNHYDQWSDNRLAYFGTSSFDAGAVAARLLFDRLDPGADIVVGRIVHRGDAGSNQWRNREAGFRSYLEAHAFRGRLHYAALRLDDEACNGRVLDEMFRENPSIAGAVTFNSTCYILAGYLAARRRDGVRLVGYDVIRRNGEMLSAGVVTALVAQRPEAQGYRAVMALCEWLVEGRAPSKVNNMPIDILLKENIPYYKNNII